MTAGLKGKKGIPMMRIKDDCIKFGLKEDAMLRVLVSVTNVDSQALQTQDNRDPMPEYKDCASDPSGVYDEDDFDYVGHYVVADENYAEYEEDEDDDTSGAGSISLSSLFNSPLDDDGFGEEDEEAAIIIRDNLASVSTLDSPENSAALRCSQYSPLLPLEDDEYEVGNTIFVENVHVSEVRALRRQLSESKYIIESLTDALSSALQMSKGDEKKLQASGLQSTAILQAAMNTILTQAAPSLPPYPPPLTRFVAPQLDICICGPNFPPPPRPPPQLEACELIHELSKIVDSPPEYFVDDGSVSKRGDASDDSPGHWLSGEDVVIPRHASACSLETVHEEDEEHAFEETEMIDKRDSVVKDEVKEEGAIELTTDKSNEADELTWKNILDKISSPTGTSPYTSIQDKFLKHHIRKGLPDSMRRRVWVVLTGVDCLMKERAGVYQELLRQANSISQTSELTPDGRHSNRTVLNPIDKDTERTSLKHFSSERTFSRRGLRRVLRAYSQLDREVGYCQGMSYIVAMFLSFLSEEEAFWLLVVVMNEQPFNLRELFSEDMSGTHEMLYIAEKLMKQFFPKLSKHLHREEVRPSMFVTQWLMTLYTNSFPLDMVSRVWDSFLVEGWKIIYRVMLGLMKHAEGTLLHLSFEHILHYLSSFPRKLDGQTIMQEALKIGLKKKHIQKHACAWQRTAARACSQVPTSPKKVSHLDSATLSTCSTSTR